MAHCTRCGRVPPSPPLSDLLVEDEDGEREEEDDGGAGESGEDRRAERQDLEEGVVQEGRGKGGVG